MEPVEVGLERPQGWTSVTFAKDQPEYLPLPTLRGRAPEERNRIAAGEDLFLELLTFGHPLQPILLSVGHPANEAFGPPPIAPLPSHEPNQSELHDQL